MADKPAETADAPKGTEDTAKPADTGDATSKTEEVTDWAAEAEKWKSLSRKNEARAKENATKAQEFDKLTEAQKTEQERLNDRVAAAEAKAAEAEGKVLRADVASEKGVPASLLSGKTRDELEASADELLKFRGEKKDKPVDFGGGPKGGDVKGGDANQLTKEQLKGMSAADIVKARADGRLKNLLNPKK